MVEIREESTEPGASDPPPTSRSAGGQASIIHMKAKPVDTVLWLLRIATLLFALFHVFPFFGSQSSCYMKTLVAGAATNALRLHQRLGGFRFSREFLSQMFLEDACHYLFYCILFIGSTPVTMVLLPVFLFAFLHASNFTLQLLTSAGLSGFGLYRGLQHINQQYAHSLLNVIAVSEICMMPMVVFMTFAGYCSFLLPFIYYRFLTLRYMSRRNPNTRQAFYQMRVALDQSVARPNCPVAVRTVVHKCISFVERLAPQPTA